jgi:hypothetical protein
VNWVKAAGEFFRRRALHWRCALDEPGSKRYSRCHKFGDQASARSADSPMRVEVVAGREAALKRKPLSSRALSSRKIAARGRSTKSDALEAVAINENRLGDTVKIFRMRAAFTARREASCAWLRNAVGRATRSKAPMREADFFLTKARGE